MPYAVAVAAIAILGFLLWRSQRQLEDALKAAVIERAAIITEAAQERQALLNRIQAPAVAVAQTNGTPDRPEVIEALYDSDEEYWDVREKAELSGS